jgi:hypothetical protein
MGKLLLATLNETMAFSRRFVEKQALTVRSPDDAARGHD